MAITNRRRLFGLFVISGVCIFFIHLNLRFNTFSYSGSVRQLPPTPGSDLAKAGVRELNLTEAEHLILSTATGLNISSTSTGPDVTLTNTTDKGQLTTADKSQVTTADDIPAKPVHDIPAKPVHDIVFVKTHKTASSTVASIFQRYGYAHNLTFLVPSGGSLINYAVRFNASMIDSNRTGKLNILTNHARYDRREMSSVFPDARYVTILRDPVTQFESAYYYFDISDVFPGTNSLEIFMKDPQSNFVKLQKAKHYMQHSMHNHQLFDLGVELGDMYRHEVFDEKIDEIAANFDLVMIREYFDESLLLLKNLLGWNIDDVVYLVKGSRAAKYRHEMSQDLRAKIRAWNAGDVKLYKHFNATLWRKIAAYGPTFESDLAALRQKLRAAQLSCLNMSRKTLSVREEYYPLKKPASAWCRRTATSDFDFTTLIRKRMDKMKIPKYKFSEQYVKRPNAKSTKGKKPSPLRRATPVRTSNSKSPPSPKRYSRIPTKPRSKNVAV